MKPTCPSGKIADRCKKIAHWTRAEAQAHASEVRQKKGRFLSVYRCRRCGCWHVGPSKALRHLPVSS